MPVKVAEAKRERAEEFKDLFETAGKVWIFLKERRDEAYSVLELAGALGVDIEALSQAVNLLKVLDFVDSIYLRNTMYFYAKPSEEGQRRDLLEKLLLGKLTRSEAEELISILSLEEDIAEEKADFHTLMIIGLLKTVAEGYKA